MRLKRRSTNLKSSYGEKQGIKDAAKRQLHLLNHCMMCEHSINGRKTTQKKKKIDQK